MSEAALLGPSIKQATSKIKRVVLLRDHLIRQCSSTNILEHRYSTHPRDKYTTFSICGCCGSRVLDKDGLYVRCKEQGSQDTVAKRSYLEKDGCGFLVFPGLKKEELPVEKTDSNGIPYIVKEFIMNNTPISITWRDR